MPENLVSARFSKAADSYDKAAFLQKNMAGSLVKLIDNTIFYEDILEIGCGTGYLSNLLIEKLRIKHLYINDISAPMLQKCQARLQHEDKVLCTFINEDARLLKLEQPCDAIISNAVFQWFDDLKSALNQIKANLKEGGSLYFSTFLSDTCIELKHLGFAGIDYLDKDGLSRVLQDCGFEIERFIDNSQSSFFKDPKELLLYFKATGVNSLSQAPWTKGQLQTFIKNYTACYKTSLGVRLTWCPCFIKAIFKG